ncbi:winged helix-turn-helix transcriptional regulator [Verticiella sediminum]|uniref:Winged helix-turn-helix transcriptional regulator n=1 Tax=Verticiella sediminum TaxID=1247510 RepID=A0A556AJ75_9BURK|nr:winged helix-turn-helix domain-containing protein [Verticiella sediminum]TSH92919.1 winged helix-turn-helix transcriptional regulator [Verticiella sediminum]
MVSVSSFTEIAALAGDVARAGMLMALMDGRALTAGELARVASVSASTTSAHLARLAEGGLVTVEKQGRHRYHRLASREVAGMLESIMAFAAQSNAAGAASGRRRPVTGPRDRAQRFARTCYDHLAGELAVAITDSMIASGHLELSGDGGLLTESGKALMGRLGIDLDASARPASRRVFCRACLDWSERRAHLGGTLGALLCRHYLERGWTRRTPDSRTVDVTPPGRRALQEAYDLPPSIWPRVPAKACLPER